MQPTPTASTSALPLHTLSLAPPRPPPPSPVRWIVSLGDEGRPQSAAFPTPPSAGLAVNQPTRRGISGQTVVRDRFGLTTNEEDDFQGGYGPTTRRRGRMRFVPATALTRPVGEGLEGGNAGLEVGVGVEGRKEDKGASIKDFYASLVGLNAAAPPPISLPSLKRAPPRPPAPPPDLDLTLDSDSDSDSSIATPSSDDDLVILNPSGLPERAPPPLPRPRIQRRRRPPPPPPPAALLPAADHIPLPPPIQYALPSTSFGFSLLARQGWRPGQPLGPPPAPTPAPAPAPTPDHATAAPQADAHYARRLLVPLKAVEKHDRRGLGPNGEDERRRRKAREEARKIEKERRRREGRTKGAGERGRQEDREDKGRRELLASLRS